jgi:hypothetical protein
MQLLAQKSITEIEHPPCSPDLAPDGFWLFSEIKSSLKGRRFQDTEDIKNSDEGTETYSTTRFTNVSNSGNIVGLSA